MTEHKLNLRLVINGCREHNPNSQRKLYEHYYGYAMNIGLRYSKSRDEALEIVNDGFLKVFHNLDKYDDDFQFRAWLRRIIVNTAIDYYRKSQRSPISIDFDHTNEPSDNAFDLPEINTSIDMLPIVQDLPPRYRMVFNLFVMEGFKHQEIAEQLNINVSTSKSNLARAKAKLREAWLKKNNKKALNS